MESRERIEAESRALKKEELVRGLVAQIDERSAAKERERAADVRYLEHLKRV